VSRKKANKKLTKLYITKALTKTTNCAFRDKTRRGTTKKICFRRFSRDRWPPFRSAPVTPPPLSNSFRRHCFLHKFAMSAIVVQCGPIKRASRPKRTCHSPTITSGRNCSKHQVTLGPWMVETIANTYTKSTLVCKF